MSGDEWYVCDGCGGAVGGEGDEWRCVEMSGV